MDIKIQLVLIGGFITLVSASAGFLLQHILAMKKMLTETRQHPFRLVYDKQIEFFDKLMPVLNGINVYISTIDVNLDETSVDAVKRGREAAKLEMGMGREAVNDIHVLTKLLNLLDQYSIYLPEKLLNEGYELHFECLSLGQTQLNKEQASHCIDLLFSFKNNIREFVGIKKLSEDFQRAFKSKY